MTATADSTPLIHLAAAGDFDLLLSLFRRVVVAEAVYAEVVVQGHGRPGSAELSRIAADRIQVIRVEEDASLRAMAAQSRLQRGELHTIHLAQRFATDVVLLDEQPAVELARALGLPVLRTGALYVTAKRAGLVSSVRVRLDALRAMGFWLRDRDYEMILRAADEI